MSNKNKLNTEQLFIKNLIEKDYGTILTVLSVSSNSITFLTENKDLLDNNESISKFYWTKYNTVIYFINYDENELLDSLPDDDDKESEHKFLSLLKNYLPDNIVLVNYHFHKESVFLTLSGQNKDFVKDFFKQHKDVFKEYTLILSFKSWQGYLKENSKKYKFLKVLK